MDLEQTYQNIHSELLLGARAMVRFNENEVEEIAKAATAQLTSLDQESLRKILCIMEHSAMDNADL